MNKKSKGAVFCKGGDINLSDIQWTTHIVDNHSFPTSVNSLFLDLIHDTNLEQIVSFLTRKDNVLDLSKIHSLVNRYEAVPGISDPDFVFMDTDMPV